MNPVDHKPGNARSLLFSGVRKITLQWEARTNYSASENIVFAWSYRGIFVYLSTFFASLTKGYRFESALHSELSMKI